MQKMKETVKSPVFWARVAGFGIPVLFLLYVLYINFLPFGYSKTFMIDVGSENDTKVSEFYLEPSQDLSSIKTESDGNTYRELMGTASAMLKPNIALEDTDIDIKLQGENVSFIPPQVAFSSSSTRWNYDWDLAKEAPKELINSQAFAFEGSNYFNGSSARMELGNSADLFEDGPFTVYAEWRPTDNTKNFQEIVGHYNWELVQNSDSVQFQVGRMNNATGTTYSIRYPVTAEFFDKFHDLIAVYSPSTTTTAKGYIELFIDHKFVSRIDISSDRIWKDYNEKINLSFGWTSHNYKKSPYYKGFIRRISIQNEAISFNTTSAHLEIGKDTKNLSILITSSGLGKLLGVQAYVAKQ